MDNLTHVRHIADYYLAIAFAFKSEDDIDFKKGYAYAAAAIDGCADSKIDFNDPYTLSLLSN